MGRINVGRGSDVQQKEVVRVEGGREICYGNEIGAREREGRMPRVSVHVGETGFGREGGY
jgi:hypothetical protein